MQELALVLVRMANVAAEAFAAIRNEAVRYARDQGASWDAIAKAMGVTKGLAHKRHGAAIGEPRMVNGAF